MKNTFKSLVAVVAGLILFSVTIDAQQENKNHVFEFTVTGMLKETDAALLDSAMMKRKGIYSSKTDFKTKKITVTCISFIDFKMLNAVVVSKGFEAEEKNVVVKTQDQ